MLNKLFDAIDKTLCKAGVLRVADWQDVLRSDRRMLYAGKLYRRLPQYRTHFGLTPFWPSSRNIPHDVASAMPLPDNTIERYQSEDVFEHIPYEEMRALIDDIYRVLKPGGLFRLSLPDYGSAIYASRSIRNAAGEIVFDPGGGGRYVNQRIDAGGHLWFPTYANVCAIFDQTEFARHGTVDYLHYWTPAGSPVVAPIDYELGFIQRTPDHDRRLIDRREPLSIVIDARKAG